MFNATGQSGVLFGNSQNPSLFGQTQTQSSGFFGSSNSNLINGTTVKYVPLSGTDTIQKNNTTVNVATKLNCISAMKEYEAKSLEELRFEDYTANRINPPKSNTTGMFGGNQTTPTLFNNQNSLFQNSSPFGLPQQNVLGTTAQTPLFGSTSQTNTFGSKTLFGSTPTSTNSAFGSFNSQSKTGALFGAGTQNKQIFGSPQSTQSTSLFGGTQQTPAPSLFGNQQQTQQTGFFGGLQSQQQASQSTGLFNTNTSTSSFGFQSQSSTGLFGANNTAKPFGAGNTNFSFSNSNAQTNPTLFGGNTQPAGLFSQNNANQGFGSSSKASLFPNTNTFNTPASSQSQNIFPQTNTGFGQNNMFGNQPKTNPSPFGVTSVFNNTQKSNLFAPTSNTGFGTQNNPLFGNFGSNNQPFGTTITTSTIAPANTLSQIGITTPAEAVFQQQVTQQKILSLVSNRPYGINKLFMGQNMTTISDSKTLIPDNNANILSLAIKRNETENSAVSQRRRILNQKTKINPNQMSHAFSGFDEDEDYSVKSNKFDSFMIRREDWKFLPPDAFDKSRKSLVSNNNSPINLKHNAGILSPMASVSQFIRETNKNHCSTPLSDDSFRRVELESNYNGRTSPVNLDKKRDPINNNSNGENDRSMKSKELKEESLTVSNGSIKKLNDSYSQNKLSNQVNRKENDDDDDDDDESINGDVDKSCQVTLTNEGYYTAPTMDILHRLVSDDACWVENFIIGRKSYGSIRFPGFTNVFGLNMDEIVNISSKEVIVYPNEELKPEVGEGLNKSAQIVLHEIFPTDKSSGAVIKDSDRLKKMNFEERLRKISVKNGSKFISYTPEKGIWIFEVDHFSRYGYFDSDDEEVVATSDKSTQQEADSSKFNFKKETLIKLAGKENISNSNVISAEADSLSNIECNQSSFKQKSALDKLSVNCGSRNLYKLKQSFYKYDSDEEVGTSGLFNNDFKKHSDTFINKFELGEIEKYQPLPKKFESSEMGERIFNSQMEYSNVNIGLHENQLIGMDEENDRRPIKPLTAEHIAPTVQIESCNKNLQRVYIPNHLRDLRILRMPYLFDKFMNYMENITVDAYKNYSNDASLIQGNRFRVGLHVSCNENSQGLKFIKINNTNKENASISSFRNFHKRNGPNTLMILKCNYELSNYQEKLIDSAFLVSQCLTDVDSKCPFWSPVEGLDVLKLYLNIHNKLLNTSSNEKLLFGRIIELCNALWNNAGNEQECPPRAIQEVCRKQLLSKWIRMECREKLMEEVETVLNSSTINIDKCNTLILNAMCSGEINLACQLAVLTKQHRLSLLIAQSASNSQSREMVKEQLNQWLKSKTDLHIPRNILCIYVLLSGQTSFVLSDGSSLAPFKHMNWVQAFGSHLWHTQSYLSSIKSAIELYDEVFKTELDIPSPFPVGIEHDPSNEDVKCYDCCYHLIKLYCDRLYDLDVLLNPPTISRDFSHKLSWDWSASWHLANILTSLGFSKNISAKISMEYAVQLERGGLWQMAAFVILHVPDSRIRSRLIKSLIYRHVKNSKNLTENEKFLVDKLNVPIEWIHEGKAIYCKASENIELEAYHWLKCGQYECSYQLYINHIIPNLLINDKFEKIKEILGQFVNNKSDRVLANWPMNGEIYLKYIYIETTLRTLKLTNKLANYSYLIDCERNEGGFGEEFAFDENEELNIQIQKLKVEINKLSKAVEGFKVNNDAQRICKQQFVSVSNRFLEVCLNEIN